jgi:hypothetical protein
MRPDTFSRNVGKGYPRRVQLSSTAPVCFYIWLLKPTSTSNKQPTDSQNYLCNFNEITALQSWMYQQTWYPSCYLQHHYLPITCERSEPYSTLYSTNLHQPKNLESFFFVCFNKQPSVHITGEAHLHTLWITELCHHHHTRNAPLMMHTTRPTQQTLSETCTNPVQAETMGHTVRNAWQTASRGKREFIPVSVDIMPCKNTFRAPNIFIIQTMIPTNCTCNKQIYIYCTTVVNATPRVLYPRETDPVPTTQEAGCGRPGRARKISPPTGIRYRTFQPVASRYTAYAIPALQKIEAWLKSNKNIGHFARRP